MPRLAIDDAVGMQAYPRERWREEIASTQTPKHRARNPRDDAGREKSRKARVLTCRPALDDFMKMAELKAAPRQALIDRGYPEGQKRGLARAVRFHPLQLAAKFGNSDGRAGEGHPQTLSGEFECSTFVLFRKRVNTVEQKPAFTGVSEPNGRFTTRTWTYD